MLAGCVTPGKALVEPAPVPLTAEPSTPPCGFRDDVINFMAQVYQETPVAIGLASVGGLVEVLASAGGTTWTIIVTRPDRWTCLVASGEGWRTIDELQPEGTAL